MKPNEAAHLEATFPTTAECPASTPPPTHMAQSKGEGERQRRRLWTWMAVLIFLLVAGLAWISVAPRGPTFGGKGICQWFAEWKSQGWALDSATARAFAAMEGDAVPFLIQVLGKTGPSRTERWYEGVFKRVPSSLMKSLPKPRTSATYRQRRIQAILMLGIIGEVQRRQSIDEGKPSSKLSITNAFPALKDALNDPDPNISMLVPYAITGLGPLAAPLVPELMRNVADENARASREVFQALGWMGPLASNAVPVLIQVVADRRRQDRQWAAQSLGEIGAPASEAAAVLSQAISEPDAFLRIAALAALCQIGHTPAEAVPALTGLKQEPDLRIHGLACLALWNQDRQNTNLFDEIVAVLRSPQHGDLVSALEALGTNAAPFAAELQRMRPTFTGTNQ